MMKIKSFIKKVGNKLSSGQLNSSDLKSLDYNSLYSLLEESNLIDKDFYLSRYADVRKRKVDPIQHYIKHGAKENRWPNNFFDTKLYKETHNLSEEINPLVHYLHTESSKLSKTSDKFSGTDYYYYNKDVSLSGMNPLRHYMEYGRNEKRKTIRTVVEKNKNSIIGNPKVYSRFNNTKIKIIVPVYNAAQDVMNCLESLVNNTELGVNVSVLILDDCSPDSDVTKVLAQFESKSGITVIRNEKNLGYTGNVNKGIELSGEDDVVLLNSDTIVTPNWVRQLAIAAYSNDTVGTVTAISNGAGAFSVPHKGYNEIPKGLTVDAISRIISPLMASTYVDVPTGNGFCLYIKRELINDIGIFDIDKFPRGYGEENDFCMRARENGWDNIVDLKTYIYHKRSASFKENKLPLVEAGVSQVKNDFPFYSGATKSIGASDIFSKSREIISKSLDSATLSQQRTKPCIMFVISTRTGGTPQTNLDLMNGLGSIYSCYTLASNGRTVEVLKSGGTNYKLVEKFILKDPIKYSNHTSNEYDQLVNYILYKYNVSLLHIRHIAWHSLRLPKVAKNLGIPVIKSFHDFYALCPSVNLLDENLKLNMSGLVSGSVNPLWKDETVIAHSENTSKYWKKRMSNALLGCEHYITTCETAKDVISSNLSIGDNSNFTVIPHGRNFEQFCKPRTEIQSDVLNVLLPGNITATKGKHLIIKIKQLDINNQIRFHVLGTCDDELRECVIDHGSYERHDFLSKVGTIKPDIAGVFSIWPETYCHTLTESWAAGLPVIGVAYGAVKDRIEKHEAGWLVENDAAKCYELLIEILHDKVQFAQKSEAVVRWQNGYGKHNTVEAMTGQYLSIYQKYLKKDQSVRNRLGLVVKGHYPNVPPTAYVRMVDWMPYFEEKFELKPSILDWSRLLTGEITQYSKVIIQRDAIPSHAVDWCLDALKREGIEYIYEIDDNLLDVPEHIDKDGTYKAYRSCFDKLISSASEVHVTNDELKRTISEFNSNIVVRPNKVWDHRWKDNDHEFVDLNLDKGKVNLLYFGSRTHQEDLDFLLEVMDEINKSEANAHLYVIGCGDFEERSDITRLTPPSARYDIFVDWLKSISKNFDAGVCPLIESKFAKNKSNLKSLELNAMGLTAICSNVGSYKDVNNIIASNVYLVNNSPEQWSTTIKNKVAK